MTLREDAQRLEPGSILEFFILDGSPIDISAGTLYFHGHTHEGPIVWQGVTYQPWPIEAKGFAKTGERPPTPTFTASNINQSLTAMCLQFDDMVGAILTRKRTLLKYLDAVNFPGGVNPTANPAEIFPDEIWYVDRKEFETHVEIKWNLASAMDFNGVELPGRPMTANFCFFQYRDGEGCPYSGGPVATELDVPTATMALDKCSRKVSGCKLRFGANAELPIGAFPASGLMRT